MSEIKNYRAKDVQAIFCISRTTLYDLIKKNELPPPIKIGRSSVWLKSEIDALIEQRKNERDHTNLDF